MKTSKQHRILREIHALGKYIQMNYEKCGIEEFERLSYLRTEILKIHIK